MLFPIRKFIPWVVLVIGLFLIVVTSWPMPSDTTEWNISNNSTQYTFILEWPSALRVGETRPTVLKVTRDGQNLPDMDAPSALEARLEFAGVQFSPNGSIVQSVGSSNTNLFHWSIAAGQAGNSTGTLWVYSIIPGSGANEERVPLTARPLEIRSIGHRLAPIHLLRWIGVLLLAAPVFLMFRSAKIKQP